MIYELQQFIFRRRVSYFPHSAKNKSYLLYDTSSNHTKSVHRELGVSWLLNHSDNISTVAHLEFLLHLHRDMKYKSNISKL